MEQLLRILGDAVDVASLDECGDTDCLRERARASCIGGDVGKVAGEALNWLLGLLGAGDPASAESKLVSSDVGNPAADAIRLIIAHLSAALKDSANACAHLGYAAAIVVAMSAIPPTKLELIRDALAAIYGAEPPLGSGIDSLVEWVSGAVRG